MKKNSAAASVPADQAPSPRDGARSALTTLRLSLFTPTAHPPGPLTGTRDKTARRLMIGGAVLVVLLTAGTCTSITLDTGRLPYGIALVLGLAQTTPVLLALTRPVAAWYTALAATVVIALVTTPGSGGSWPWTIPGLVAYVTVLLMLAWSVSPLVSTVVWALTVLTGSLLTLRGGSSLFSGIPLAAVLCAGACALGAVLRGRSDVRRQLKHQEHLTEAERARNILLQERARIARELHDVVAHHMSVIAVQAEAAPYRVDSDKVPRELGDSFTTIRDNALTALNELRHLLGMLRSEDTGGEQPLDRAPQPTMADIEELVANVRAAGADVRMTVDGTPSAVPPGVGLSVFRILQEALSNALRHAPGCPVGVEIAYGGEEVQLRVVNSLPTAPVSSRAALTRAGAGHGVLGMRERAAMLGGTLRAGPAPGPDGHFEVLALLPIGEGAHT